MAARASDFVVVGAGVVGTAVAYHLARDGAKVTGIDANAIGSGASLHGTGLVWQLVWNTPDQYRLAMEGRRLLFELVPQLEEETGIDTLFHTFDTIWPTFDEGGMEFFQRDLDVAGGDVQVEWLSREEVLRLEPRVSADVIRGALVRGSAQVDGYRLTLAQARAAEQHGAEFLTRRATGLETRSGRVTAVLYPSGRLPCGGVVIAMGAWSGEASRWLGFPVPIKPLKGETIRVRHPDSFPFQVGGGLSPRKDGLLSLGATGARRFGDGDDDLVRLEFGDRGTPEGRDLLLARALRMVPDLERAEVVDHLAGPRPLSADGNYIIGAVPGLNGAYVATGHRNKGIHLGIVSARVIADLALRGTTDIAAPLAAFAPERFAGCALNPNEVEFRVPGVTI